MNWIGKQQSHPLCVLVSAEVSSKGDEERVYSFPEVNCALMVKSTIYASGLQLMHNDTGCVLASVWFNKSIDLVDKVECADFLFEHSREQQFVEKEVVDSIIYKIMIGDCF